ncbi:hypothetical protein N1851_021987 [Merluccius polli]|uniref:Reverse transcriptase domain-containing protein n=1 Tax=Merluccius polli TaxID=89951 RepID=A0AA47MIM3_MERPO|nr:hypothetical protein N1851_021987 [Merluccius polli]
MSVTYYIDSKNPGVEFGEAMEKDFRLASRKFWQTVQRLRKGKQGLAQAVFSRGGELLTRTGDIVGRWKEHFEELLNPTNLFSVTWMSGTVPVEWQTGVVVPIFKKGDRSVCSNYKGITLLSLPGKVYSRGLERRLRPIVEPQIQEEQCGFYPGLYVCFVDLEEAFDRVPRGILWGVLREYGVPAGRLVRAIQALYNQNYVVLLASSDHDLQHALGRFAAECEAVGMRFSTFKSEAMVLCRKTLDCSLRVGSVLLPQVKEFKYLGMLFMSEWKMEREMDRWIGAASAVMRALYRTVVVKRELSRKAKLSIDQSIYVPTLTYGHELWVVTERTRLRIQAAEMSFLRRVAGLSLRDRVRSSDIRRELGVQPLRRKELVEVVRALHLIRMPPGRLPLEVFWVRSTGRRPRGRPRTRWRDYISQLAWEHLGVPQEELEKSCWGEEGLELLAQLAATRPRISRRKWMDGGYTAWIYDKY